MIVKLLTDSGIYGIGTAGVGNGAAAYILNHHLKPIILGENPFNVELLWEKMFRSTLNYGRTGFFWKPSSPLRSRFGTAWGKPQDSLSTTCWAAKPARGFRSTPAACMPTMAWARSAP